ncbi:DUF1444 family protein [Brevibacillus laterosporus]|uniref:DUF1444 family protein n=1 Tax=Brevibacillus laterosporus TaxID=1465 RepID=UPI00037F9E93|nr:DUF1444 family protein [Brevibacillus laterosporus]ATO47734.1 hypothetical protein BrL25_00610 [Brevibacillus laterosporus DSM 25]MBG9804810.1 hypothetical protein [Brevibacillus laterosporus]MED2002523.1 DUF1444 family protein [Brevibacillus laterosporus]MED4761916.1 DUF1444 family protein [Brevibacillus laterosporus]TPH22976.1 DUF1444 family protein [Brevibacillus laterosporus]
MSYNHDQEQKHDQKGRESIQKRVKELLEKELPDGWSCLLDGEQIKLQAVIEGEIHERSISLQTLYKQVEAQPDNRRELLYRYIQHIMAAVKGATETSKLTGNEQRVYPVLRHSSFFDHPRAKTLVTHPHTVETTIAYALDREDGYVLLDEKMLQQAGWTQEKLHDLAMDNLEASPYTIKSDQVGEHVLYFLNSQDGYAASRILLPGILHEFEGKKTGKLIGTAIPHQDVMIIGDLANDKGAQLLAQVTHHFASKGDVPICPLPFIYQQGELETYLVVSPNQKG